MQLLDLPTELLRLIVQHCYDPWTIRLRNLEAKPDSSWTCKTEGLPVLSLLTVCKVLSRMAAEKECSSFSGIIEIEEQVSAMGTTLIAFSGNVGTRRHEWLRDRVHTLKYSNPTMNPARWRFHPRNPSVQNPNSWVPTYFPKLRHIVLNCRYQSLFAMHNLRNLKDFLSGADGRLEKQIDYRQAFFLSDERFLLENVKRGIAITVIREMGVRELDDRCQAVVVAIDYIADNAGKLVLDWTSLQVKIAQINGWPQNIRPTLASLEI